MAVEYIDAGTFYAADRAYDLLVPYPGTVNAGDFLLIGAYVKSTLAATLTAPGGFAEITHRQDPDQTPQDVYALFGKVATGSESGTAAVGNNKSSSPSIGRMWRFSGCDSGDPYESAYDYAKIAASPLALEAMTVSNNDSLCVGVGIANNDGTGFNDDGAHYTRITNDTTTLSGDAAMALFTFAHDAGTSDADEVTFSIGVYLAAMGFVISPAAGDGYPNDVNGVAAANIGKINGIANASIEKVVGS